MSKKCEMKGDDQMIDHDRLVQVTTPRCFVCKQGGTISVPFSEYEEWQRGVLIQEAMPLVSVDAREQLISGTHPGCWESLYGPSEEPKARSFPPFTVGDLMEFLGKPTNDVHIAPKEVLDGLLPFMCHDDDAS